MNRNYYTPFLIFIIFDLFLAEILDVSINGNGRKINTGRPQRVGRSPIC
jgi:hypothetical protein